MANEENRPETRAELGGLVDPLVGLAMPRDASWWARPNTNSPKKWHKARGETGVYGLPVAMCSDRIMLDDDMAADPREMRACLCKRCFPEFF